MSNVSMIDGHIDEPRMTDNEIIKALECCTIREMDCKNCLNKNQGVHCIYETMKLALDLIIRQKEEIDGLQRIVSLSIDTQNEFSDIITEQKAEIELLRKAKADDVLTAYKLAKSEAIKEFAKRLKENYCFTDRWGKIIPISTINNLVKEMTEGSE